MELHGEKKAQKAKQNFENTFQKRTPTFSTPMPNKSTLAQTIAPFTNLASMSDAKRMINAGAVEVNGKIIRDTNAPVSEGDKIKLGKRIFGIVVKS
jgi:tyrosyl-tRNA synthetase